MSKSKLAEKPNTAIILAAGSPLAALGAIFGRTSSAMVPVNGRPIIHWLLSYLRKEGITRIVLGLGILKRACPGSCNRPSDRFRK